MDASLSLDITVIRYKNRILSKTGTALLEF